MYTDLRTHIQWIQSILTLAQTQTTPQYYSTTEEYYDYDDNSLVERALHIDSDSDSGCSVPSLNRSLVLTLLIILIIL